MAAPNYAKAPFPWFGGKSKAAPVIWEALGDVDHYVEPFAGSLAVLLNRPHEANRSYHSETVNDIDGLLVNAWRSIQLSPDETAEHASNPVAEADLHARHAELVRWKRENQLDHLCGDPAWHDPRMAGWWLWGLACWIGSGFCSGRGPWSVDAHGWLVKGGNETKRQIPHLVSNGQGVNRPQLREPGVGRQIPFLGNDGRGVNRPHMREAGVEYHDVTMPRLRDWFHALSARLRHVRILNGDWRRSMTAGATKTIGVRMGGGAAGIVLDPPYADTAKRASDVYAHDSETVAHDVRAWCLEHGDDPSLRIALCGFEGEHGSELTDAGWREQEWFAGGWLSGGMGNTSKSGTHQQGRERIWFSPHCLEPSEEVAMPLFDGMEVD